MRFLYITLVSLLAPIMLAYVWFKIHLPNKDKRFLERLGFIKNSQADIWIHAASVGEMKVASNFIKQQAPAKPELKIIISSMTYTGYKEMQRQLGKDFPHFFLCLDLPFIWRKVLKILKPKMLIILERELWPNLIHQCQKSKVKIALINAKFSEKSRFKFAYQTLDLICAQSADDCEKLQASGVANNKCHTTGNLKFDLNLDSEIYKQAQDVKQQIGRPIWTAGSTHKGEDEIILNMHAQILKIIPDALLILAPRHPERFDKVHSLIQDDTLFSSVRYSAQTAILPEHDVLLLDTLGKLLLYYGASDVVLVAGSLLPNMGGHNLLEPAAFSKAVLCGKYLKDFNHVKEILLNVGGLIQIESVADGADKISRLLQDTTYREAMGAKAKSVVDNNQGATNSTLKLIIKCLEPKILS